MVTLRDRAGPQEELGGTRSAEISGLDAGRSLGLCFGFIIIITGVSGFLSFFLAVGHEGSSFPNKGSNLCPLQWQHRVLTTGPPGKSLGLCLKCKNSLPQDNNIFFVLYSPVNIEEKGKLSRK